MAHLQKAIDDAVVTFRGLAALEEPLNRAAKMVLACLTSGHKLLVCGNGGSASDATHLATEFLCRFRERPPALSGHFAHGQRRIHDRRVQRLSRRRNFCAAGLGPRREGRRAHRASPPAANPKTFCARSKRRNARALKASASSAATAVLRRAWRRLICWCRATTPRGFRKGRNCFSTFCVKSWRKSCPRPENGPAQSGAPGRFTSDKK